MVLIYVFVFVFVFVVTRRGNRFLVSFLGFWLFFFLKICTSYIANKKIRTLYDNRMPVKLHR